MDCKGFWNMCGCEVCRSKDDDLANKLESQPPDERRKTLAAAVQEMMEIRANGDTIQI